MDKFSYKLKNYESALERLGEAIEDYDKYNIESLKDAVIQRFEFTAELSWKTTREYLLSEGETDISSPKSVMKAAFAADITDDEQGGDTDI